MTNSEAVGRTPLTGRRVGSRVSRRRRVGSRLDPRRFWFGLDALVTGVNAVAYLTLSGWLADTLGGDSGLYRSVGVGLLVLAIGVGCYAIGRRSHPLLATAIVAVNVAWVVASVVVAAADLGSFDGLGRMWIALQAGVVGGLSAMQRGVSRV